MAKKINWYNNDQVVKISQIYNNGLEYSLVSEDYRQICPFVFCKDFLQDVIYACVNHKEIKIHKFEFNPAKNGYIATDKTKILIANASDTAFFARLESVFDFLHQIEDDLGLERTEWDICKEPPSKYNSGIFLLQADSKWLLAPPLLSLYSLLIRIGFVHTKDDIYKNTILKIVLDEVKTYQREDRRYLMKNLNGLNRIFNEGVELFFNFTYRNRKPTKIEILEKNYPKKTSVKKIHYECGLMAFSCNLTKKRYPFWHQEQ